MSCLISDTFVQLLKKVEKVAKGTQPIILFNNMRMLPSKRAYQLHS